MRWHLLPHYFLSFFWKYTGQHGLQLCVQLKHKRYFALVFSTWNIWTLEVGNINWKA